MPHEIQIPRLGWSMEEGTFVRWLKKSGDQVNVEEPLFELEGEKALQEIPSVEAGILHIPKESPKGGTVVAVGTLIGYLLLPGETPDSIPKKPAAAPPSAAKSAAPKTGKPVPARSTPAPPPVEIPRNGLAPAAPPSVRRLARQMGVPLSNLVGTGGLGRVTTNDVTGRGGFSARSTVASPRARRIAKELGLDWTTLPGSGRNGRVREADVRNGQQTSNGQFAAKPSPYAGLPPRRRAIAERLKASRDQTIPVTLTTVADVSGLLRLREQYKKANGPVVPAITDLFAVVIGKILAQHPEMAQRWNPSQGSLEAVSADAIDIGIAVDTPQGLLVPVVRGVTTKPVETLAGESKKLIELARGGRLGTADMQGAAITITNLGAQGIDAFTPIINYPEIAILGVGAIRKEPVFDAEGNVVAVERITLSLTFDHAAVDGAPAARFLQAIAAALANPGELIGSLN
jgi:pyruvate dehydrogenase E2 component (dihydrolipoamide acetyltransferase)